MAITIPNPWLPKPKKATKKMGPAMPRKTRVTPLLGNKLQKNSGEGLQGPSRRVTPLQGNEKMIQGGSRKAGVGSLGEEKPLSPRMLSGRARNVIKVPKKK